MSDFHNLISTLKSGADDNIRLDALKSLEQFQGVRTLDILLDIAIEDNSEKVRFAAQSAFKKTGKQPEFETYLIRNLISTNPPSAKILIIETLKKYVHQEKVNVIVADDEPDTRELISFTLRFAGWTVKSVSNGMEAYAYTRVLEPDMVLMDVRMPKMTGYDACRLMKSDLIIQHIPVVFYLQKVKTVKSKQVLKQVQRNIG